MDAANSSQVLTAGRVTSTVEEGVAALANLLKLRDEVVALLTQKHDDHCWRDWRGRANRLAELCGVTIEPEVMDPDAMMVNCAAFTRALCAGAPYVAPAVVVPDPETLGIALRTAAVVTRERYPETSALLSEFAAALPRPKPAV